MGPARRGCRRPPKLPGTRCSPGEPCRRRIGRPRTLGKKCSLTQAASAGALGSPASSCTTSPPDQANWNQAEPARIPAQARTAKISSGGGQTAANLVAVVQLGDPFGMPQRQHPGVSGPCFKDKSADDSATDSYICPQGQRLPFTGLRGKNGNISGPFRVCRAPKGCAGPAQITESAAKIPPPGGRLGLVPLMLHSGSAGPRRYPHRGRFPTLLRLLRWGSRWLSKPIADRWNGDSRSRYVCRWRSLNPQTTLDRAW